MLKIETRIPIRRMVDGRSRLQLQDVAAAAATLEAAGYDGLVTNEMKDDPFLPLTLAAQATQRVRLTTAVMIAFPRSPMVTAMTAWGLQQLSQGRLVLGLGTQVKGHNQRRYSTPWLSPGPRLREYVLALRAIWRTWQTQEKLDFQGEYYQFTLMPPAFNAGPIDHPEIPVHLAAVGPYNCRVAGEVADGLRAHPIATRKYIQEVMLPAAEAGARKAGRSLDELEISISPLVATAASESELEAQREAIRRRLAFYASTRSYKPVFDVHGWGHVVDRLHPMSIKGQWEQMPALITDEMLEELAVIAPLAELPQKLEKRFGDLVDWVLLDLPDYDAGDLQRLTAIAQAFQ